MKRGDTKIKCPCCGRVLVSYEWGYGCSGHFDGCSFGIGKIAGRLLTEGELKELVETGRTRCLEGFSRKDGTKFSASLVLEKGEDGNIDVRFQKKLSMKAEHAVLSAACPKCRGRMINGDYGWKCENGCGVFIPYILCGRTISEKEAESIIWKKGTLMLHGFTGKNGRLFNAFLHIGEDGKLRFCFPERNRW